MQKQEMMMTPNNTTSNQLTTTVPASNKSVGAPLSISRLLVGLERLPQMAIDRSDVPLNSRKLPEGKLHFGENNRGSPSSSLIKINFTQDELQEKISKYSAKLKAYESNRESVAKENEKTSLDSSLKAHQKKVSIYHQKVLEQLLMIMEQGKVKGFVYGMVTETSKPITGSSDSLRAWWKNEIMFDNASPTQTDMFCKQNSLSTNVVPESKTRSTTELLMELSDPTLGSILSLIMQQCDPPQRKFPFEKGLPPPWWPTTQESWWSQTGISTNEGPPPFRKPHDLRKKWKVAVIVGIVKLMSPNFSRPCSIVEQSRYLQLRMNAKERKFWNLALVVEAKKYCQEHPDMPLDEAIAFLHTSSSSSVSRVAPKADRRDVFISGNKASHFSSPFGGVHRPLLAPSSNTPSAWPITMTPRGQQQHSVQISRTAPKPQMAMSGSFAPQHSPWDFSYNPTLSANVPMDFQQNDTPGSSAASDSRLQGHHAQPIPYLPFDELEHPGGTPITDGTQDQIMKHWYGPNMEFNFKTTFSNQNSGSRH